MGQELLKKEAYDVGIYFAICNGFFLISGSTWSCNWWGICSHVKGAKLH